MDLTFNVVDANGLAVPGAACSASGAASATTDQAGTATIAGVAAGGGSLSVQHPSFVREDAAFSDVQGGSWNNSLFARIAVSATAVTYRVTLGRLAVAPTVEFTEDRLREMARSHADPGGVLLFHPPAFPPPARAYRFHWNAQLKIRVPDARLLPGSAPAASAHGWDRFQTTAADVPIADRGRFFWLAYPATGPNPFVVAIWSPNLPATTPLPALDFVTFFSPTTGGYTARYPYGLNYAGPTQDADQQYMSLGAKYALAEFGFAYELAAAGSAAVLVMPICRGGDWGPFASEEGLLRLLREIAVFLHRECRTSGLGTAQPGYDVNFRLAGGSLRSGAGIRDTYFGVVPSVGSVAVGFFSTGAAPAKQLMAGAGLPKAYQAADWGVPGGAGPAAWRRAWREIWDMDGFHPGTGGWPAYLNLLRDWYCADDSRRFHLCHSSGRVPPPPMRIPLLVGERPAPLWVTPSASGFGSGQEMNAVRWSAVAFDDAYVSGPDPNVMPPLGDAHHATAAIAFAHDVALTSVGIRRPLSVSRGP
jgi:hypothetical protein